jgi:actin-related protein 3
MIEVKVANNPYQRYAVWQGGSFFAGRPDFENVCHTRGEYFEYGSSICRHNAVFSHC